MSQFRPVKIIVQVVGVVEDDDGELTELATEATTVPAKKWREFVDEGGGFDQGMLGLQAQIAMTPAPV